jgi:hypothetical protein
MDHSSTYKIARPVVEISGNGRKITEWVSGQSWGIQSITEHNQCLLETGFYLSQVSISLTLEKPGLDTPVLKSMSS